MDTQKPSTTSSLSARRGKPVNSLSIGQPNCVSVFAVLNVKNGVQIREDAEDTEAEEHFPSSGSPASQPTSQPTSQSIS